jgi:archaemetzincin
MDSQTIVLLSFAHFGSDFLSKIAGAVQHEFKCQVIIKEMHLDLGEYFDAGRRQYNGDKLLKAVALMEISGDKIIALFNVDLFIPILTYIFGQAQLGGRTGIASMYRLGNERYGIINSDNILIQRFIKEVIHELGHLFGLIHCHTPTCVMRSSTYVEDIDQKEMELCPKCRSELAVTQ